MTAVIPRKESYSSKESLLELIHVAESNSPDAAWLLIALQPGRSALWVSRKMGVGG